MTRAWARPGAYTEAMMVISWIEDKTNDDYK